MTYVKVWSCDNCAESLTVVIESNDNPQRLEDGMVSEIERAFEDKHAGTACVITAEGMAVP